MRGAAVHWAAVHWVHSELAAPATVPENDVLHAG